MKAISLFSGAGGLDLGLAEVGVETLACVEIDPHCVSALRLNATASELPPRFFVVEHWTSSH